jgi:hypothetical protein
MTDDPRHSVYTSIRGNNADLIRQVVDLYIPANAEVADVTYGKGVFWRKVDTGAFQRFLPSDLLSDCPEQRLNFRALPYAAETLDVVVFDPPYVHNPGRLVVEDDYKNSETTHGLYHDDILELYRAGMEEAKRVLRVDGMLWVKCKDEIESHAQRWSHIEIYEIARELGFYAKDLFILTQLNTPLIQHKQQHARKNHSYLWIFKRC